MHNSVFVADVVLHDHLLIGYAAESTVTLQLGWERLWQFTYCGVGIMGQ